MAPVALLIGTKMLLLVCTVRVCDWQMRRVIQRWQSANWLIMMEHRKKKKKKTAAGRCLLWSRWLFQKELLSPCMCCKAESDAKQDTELDEESFKTANDSLDKERSWSEFLSNHFGCKVFPISTKYKLKNKHFTWFRANSRQVKTRAESSQI